jgi:5'-AMP-activated protein kinase catalytic alpha subunit
MVKGEAEAECTRASLLGRYEIGRTLGEGNFGKVKYARHIATGAHFAIKILDRSKILSLRINDQVSMLHHRFLIPPLSLHFLAGTGLISCAGGVINEQIRREIGTLKLLKHPNVVRLHEVRCVACPAQLQSPFSHFLNNSCWMLVLFYLRDQILSWILTISWN